MQAAVRVAGGSTALISAGQSFPFCFRPALPHYASLDSQIPSAVRAVNMILTALERAAAAGNGDKVRAQLGTPALVDRLLTVGWLCWLGGSRVRQDEGAASGRARRALCLGALPA